MSLSAEHLDAAATLALSDQVEPLYRSCFSEPPWNETEEELAACGLRLSRAVCRPGFRALAVRDTDGTLLALCYGWPTPPNLTGCDVYARLTAAIGSTAAHDLTRGAFEIAELMVAPRARGRGIGGRLLTTITAPWPRAWLSTLLDSPAARLYQRHGWRRACPLPHPGSDKTWAVFTWTASPNAP
ncbi:Acetyltransferase (GNAT) family protein [Thermomonospora echinospora]|uniref:Acetyltransferase (GNAT) family protein n=1 Tax=Thermomonospora echinospora TaxID=1992 RepID=A0A1H6CSI7_9ACTN|nr:GNAT family N-acetyltransferase [Thermomonospora echinospora]SEG75999.1 Acetyltransferase (GNAT) family protein [Thermomonospora echinospora]